jgi:hypothetical protein
VALHSLWDAESGPESTRFVLKVQPGGEPHIDGTLRRL